MANARCRLVRVGPRATSANSRPVLIYVGILLATVAGLLVVYFAVVVAWMVVLRRMARSGIHSWDLESENTEIHPFR